MYFENKGKLYFEATAMLVCRLPIEGGEDLSWGADRIFYISSKIRQNVAILLNRSLLSRVPPLPSHKGRHCVYGAFPHNIAGQRLTRPKAAKGKENVSMNWFSSLVVQYRFEKTWLFKLALLSKPLLKVLIDMTSYLLLYFLDLDHICKCALLVIWFMWVGWAVFMVNGTGQAYIIGGELLWEKILRTPHKYLPQEQHQNSKIVTGSQFWNTPKRKHKTTSSHLQEMSPCVLLWELKKIVSKTRN